MVFAPIPRPPISQRRKALALCVAGAADLLQIILLPTLGLGYILDDVIDVITAILLTAICGFKWQFVFAFFMELIPGLDLLPTWSAVALLIPSRAETIEVYRTDAAPPVTGPVLHQPIEGNAIVVPPLQTPRTNG